MATKKKTKTETVNEPKFTKEQIIHSKKYQDKRDVCMAVIPDDFNGTLSEVDSLIENFMKGKVK